MQNHARLLRKPDVLAKTGLSQAELYRQAAEGEFPKQVRISAKAVAWLESEVDSWIADRVRARDEVA
ncbi:helix-turn-helix transcriptional regulator [Tateyamaria sp.]